MDRLKSILMDEKDMERALKRIAHEIVEKNNGTDALCLAGIRRRGVPLARQIAQYIAVFEGVALPVGELDITFYRDDLSKISEEPQTHRSAFSFSVTDKKIVLVDDVLYTGRTVRAAVDALFSMGRPKCIELAILVDRGHRELPIRADFIGKNIPTSRTEFVSVKVPEFDGLMQVELRTQVHS